MKFGIYNQLEGDFVFRKALSIIYRVFLNEGGLNVIWIDGYFGFLVNEELSSDDIINLPLVYEEFFSDDYRSELECFYLQLLGEMNGVPYEQCEKPLEALAFFQGITARALWKYHQNIGGVIEAFARDFDRLDVPEERFRLYEQAQRN